MELLESIGESISEQFWYSLILILALYGITRLMLPRKFSSKKKTEIVGAIVSNCLIPLGIALWPIGMCIYLLIEYSRYDSAPAGGVILGIAGTLFIFVIIVVSFKINLKENCKFIVYAGKDPQYVENGKKITPPLGEWKLKNLIENIKRDIGWYSEI